MDDEKAVEVMARAMIDVLGTFPGGSKETYDDATEEDKNLALEFARRFTAAIRAQGGEVVWWGDDMHKPTGTAEGQHFSNFPVTVVCENKRAILRGPEVKP